MTIFRFMNDIYLIYEFLLDDISFYPYNKAKGIIGEINMHDQNEYEFVNYSKLKHFQIGFVEILYRNLHIHKEFEIGLILNGSADILYNQQRYPVHQGDLFIFNPNEAHEITAAENQSARFVYMHLSRNFCNEYLNLLRHIVFDAHIISGEFETSAFQRIRSAFLQTVMHYIQNDALSPLHCMGALLSFLNLLMETLPYHALSHDDYIYDKKNSIRMERILEIIDTHYIEKLSLAQIAEEEGVSASYLSYYIHKTTGMTFQDLLTNARLEKAAKLLIQTNMRSIDICLESGFSDPKYLNRAFQKHFHCSPSEFRDRRSLLADYGHARCSNQTYVDEAQGTLWITDFIRNFSDDAPI